VFIIVARLSFKTNIDRRKKRPTKIFIFNIDFIVLTIMNFEEDNNLNLKNERNERERERERAIEVSQ